LAAPNCSRENVWSVIFDFILPGANDHLFSSWPDHIEITSRSHRDHIDTLHRTLRHGLG
jgi:hypothetical protein